MHGPIGPGLLGQQPLSPLHYMRRSTCHTWADAGVHESLGVYAKENPTKADKVLHLLETWDC